MEVLAYCIYYTLCLSFQFSVYFAVSEMRVIWVISCISNNNIDQKCFAFAKAPQTRPHVLAQFFAFQNATFWRKHILKHYQTPDFHFCSHKVRFGF